MRAKILIPLFLLLALSACKGDLKQIANTLVLVSEANATLQSTVIDAHKIGAIEKSEADAVVKVTKRIAEAGVEASELTEEYARMPESDRDELLEILTPALDAVSEAIADPEIGAISHEPTRITVQASLLTLKSLLSTIRLFLVIGGDDNGSPDIP